MNSTNSIAAFSGGDSGIDATRQTAAAATKAVVETGISDSDLAALGANGGAQPRNLASSSGKTEAAFDGLQDTADTSRQSNLSMSSFHTGSGMQHHSQLDGQPVLTSLQQAAKNGAQAHGGDNGGGTRNIALCTMPAVTPPCDFGEDGCATDSRGVGGIGSGSGDAIGVSPHLGTSGAYGRNYSQAGVRYADGMAWVSNEFIPTGNGFGSPWGSGRYWTSLDCNIPGGNTGTFHSELPFVQLDSSGRSDKIFVISSGLNIREFSGLSNGVYTQGPFYLHGKEKFVHDTTNHEYVHYTTTGEILRYHDHTVSPEFLQGQLKSKTDAFGITTLVNYDSTTQSVIRGPWPLESGKTTDIFTYTYEPSLGWVTSVNYRRTTEGGPTSTVRQTSYTYYDGIENNGILGSLKYAVVSNGTAALDTTYYRYYKADGFDVEGKEGYEGGLKFVFGPQSYARLKAAFPFPENESDANVAPYADKGFEYILDDGVPRVKSVTIQGQGCSACSGGQGTFQYTYSTNTNAGYTDAPGNWKYRTVETLPDGNVNIVYSNYLSQTLLTDFGAAGGGGDRWVHFYQYNVGGQVIFHANPSAIQKDGNGKYYDDTKHDLLNKVSNNFQYLADSQGLIEIINFAEADTATELQIGDVLGYLKDTRIRKGELGADVVQSRTKYWKLQPTGDAFAVPIYPVGQQTVYRDATSNPDSGGSPQNTNYDYEFLFIGEDKKPAIRKRITTYPSVSAGQNGPGTSEVRGEFFNMDGLPIWEKDGDGFVHYTAYDRESAGITKRIVDADTSLQGYSEPSPWNSPMGDRLKLTTQYTVDPLGRTTKLTDPNGNITHTVYLDANYEVRVYPGWYTTPTGACASAGGTQGCTTGPIQVWREDRGLTTSYTEMLTMSLTPVPATGGDPIGSELITNATLHTLSRSFTSPGGQVIRDDSYYNLAGLTYSTGNAGILVGATGSNYYTAEYGYDNRGRRNRTKNAVGTIYRTVYDGLNRPLRSWVGTNEGANWTEQAPGDLRIVNQNIYDGTGILGGTPSVGDSNRTQAIEYPTPKLLPTDSEPADRRITRFWYDWRNRVIAAKRGVQAGETDDVNRPLTAYTLDNLSQTVMQEQYDGDLVTAAPVAISAGCFRSPTAQEEPDFSRRRSCANTDFDDRGRVYNQHTYLVNQTNGIILESDDRLTTSTWYDLRGGALKAKQPGGQVSKTQYDSAGRATATYISDGGIDAGWIDADDVAGDLVIEQTESQLDKNGNATLVTHRARFHDELATATGALVDKSMSPKARVTYVAGHYDALDRVTHMTDVGTNGGSAYSWPTSPPLPTDRSDTLLLTEYQYNAAGWFEWVTDPRALKTKTEYDNVGRVTKTVENYTGDGTPTATTNRTTQYVYNGNNNVTLLTAVLPAGGFQKTQHDYGVTTTGGSDLNSNDLLGLTKYPRKTTGEPSIFSSDQESFKYNGLGEVKEQKDRNQTVRQFSFDVAGRPTKDAVTTLGNGVNGSVLRLETGYDTAGRPYLFTSYDAASGGSVVNEVKRDYSGLGQLTAEWQSHSGVVTGSSPKVQYVYSEMPGGANHSRLTKMIYPNGRVLRHEYNAGIDSDVSRLSYLADEASGAVSTHLEEYGWLGLATPVVRARPEIGVDLTYVKQGTENDGDAGDKYTGLDRFGRIVDQRWRNTSDGTHTDRFQYGYDRNGNRLYRENLAPLGSGFSELYHINGNNGYDGFNQLTAFSRGQLNGAKDTIASPSRYQNWTLDVMGNWDLVTSNSGTDDRDHNKQNQITSISGQTTPAYDSAGNTTTDQTGKTLTYDAWNRLVSVSGTPALTHAYDALSRRIKETRGSAATDLYYSDQWQVLEEREGSSVNWQYVWSPLYVDALLLADDLDVISHGFGDGLGDGGDQSQDDGFGDDPGSEPLTQRLYVQQDANWNVTALVDGNATSQTVGEVLERYIYDPYGRPTVLDPSWNTLTASEYDWVYLHQGGRYDVATGLYNFRMRDYSSTLGRWMQVDPLGYAAGDNNLYRSFGDNPNTFVDPLGLDFHHWFPKKYARDIKSLCNFFDIDFFTTGDVGSINDKNSYHYWIERTWNYPDKFERDVLRKSTNCCELLLNTIKLIAKTGAQLRLEKCGVSGPYFPPLFHYETKTPTDQLLDDLVKLACTQGPPKSMPPIPVPVPVPVPEPVPARPPGGIPPIFVVPPRFPPIRVPVPVPPLRPAAVTPSFFWLIPSYLLGINPETGMPYRPGETPRA